MRGTMHAMSYWPQEAIAVVRKEVVGFVPLYAAWVNAKVRWFGHMRQVPRPAIMHAHTQWAMQCVLAPLSHDMTLTISKYHMYSPSTQMCQRQLFHALGSAGMGMRECMTHPLAGVLVEHLFSTAASSFMARYVLSPLRHTRVA